MDVVESGNCTSPSILTSTNTLFKISFIESVDIISRADTETMKPFKRVAAVMSGRHHHEQRGLVTSLTRSDNWCSINAAEEEEEGLSPRSVTAPPLRLNVPPAPTWWLGNMWVTRQLYIMNESL